MDEFKERYTLMNELYQAIYPRLINYERKGFNAHQRAQTIVSKAIEQCDDWVRIQVRTNDTGPGTSRGQMNYEDILCKLNLVSNL